MAKRGRKPGTPKTGGRKVGSKSKHVLALEHRDNPLVLLSSKRIEQILTNTLPCSVCRGTKETPYELPAGSHAAVCRSRIGAECSCQGIGQRPCASCKDGFEQLSPEVIAKVAMAVREEAYPKLKSIEHKGTVNVDLMAQKIIAARKARMLQQ